MISKPLFIVFVVLGFYGCVDSSPSDAGVLDGEVIVDGRAPIDGTVIVDARVPIDASGEVTCVGVVCGAGELCRMWFGGQDAAAEFADGGVRPTPRDECVPLPEGCAATECDINGPVCAACVEGLCAGRGVSYLRGRQLGCGGA